MLPVINNQNNENKLDAHVLVRKVAIVKPLCVNTQFLAFKSYGVVFVFTGSPLLKKLDRKYTL